MEEKPIKDEVISIFMKRYYISNNKLAIWLSEKKIEKLKT